jgi:hypothetical protein
VINSDDIEAFREAHGEAMDKAQEFSRRAFKGLPVDRYGSAHDLFSVAQGIKAMDNIIELQTKLIVDLFNDIQARGSEAMRLHTQDSKYAD